MNPAKAQIKTIVAEEFGRHIEKMGEKAGEKVLAHKGGKEAFELGAKRVGELAEHIDKDIEEGVINEFVGEPLKVAAYAKRYLKRAMGALDNLATAAQIAIYKTEGQQIGLNDANTYINKQWQEEKAKLEALQKGIEDGSIRPDDGPPPRGPDGHPGPSLKSQRQAEAEGQSKQVDPKGDTEEDKRRGQSEPLEKKKAAKPKAKAGTKRTAKPKGKKKPKG